MLGVRLGFYREDRGMMDFGFLYGVFFEMGFVGVFFCVFYVYRGRFS